MTLKEMKIKVLALIEELNKDSEVLTDDPDIAGKIASVINQVQYELARIKKISTYTAEDVTAEEPFNMNTLPDFYQLRMLRFKNKDGVTGSYELIDNMVIFEESGTATFYYYKYPEMITDNTSDSYEFELSPDCLEVMPYGVAADLLKSDKSTNYGKIYADRYESMIQRLDPRYSTGMISIEGGVDI